MLVGDANLEPRKGRFSVVFDNPSVPTGCRDMTPINGVGLLHRRAERKLLRERGWSNRRELRVAG